MEENWQVRNDKKYECTARKAYCGRNRALTLCPINCHYHCKANRVDIKLFLLDVEILAL